MEFVGIIHTITKMIIWLGFFSAVFFSYYYYLKFRNKERILLIEKNVDLSEFYKKSEKNFPWLMIGFAFLGIGICLIMPLSLVLFTALLKEKEGIVLALISSAILFGAIGIIVGHSFEQKKKARRG